MEPLPYSRGMHSGLFSSSHYQHTDSPRGVPYGGTPTGRDPTAAYRRKSCPPSPSRVMSLGIPELDRLKEEDVSTPWTSLYEENSMEEPMQMSPNVSQKEFHDHSEMRSPVSALTSALLDLATERSPIASNRQGWSSLNTHVRYNHSPGRRMTMHGTPLGLKHSSGGPHETFDSEICGKPKQNVGRSLTGSAPVVHLKQKITTPPQAELINPSLQNEEKKLTETEANSLISGDHQTKSLSKKRSRCKTARLVIVALLVAAVGVAVKWLVFDSASRCSDGPLINMTSLDIEMKNRVFGQHIATELVKRSINQYLTFDKSGKPLVLSFHGWTGIGKNHLSNIVAEHLPQNCVQKIIIPLHFPHVGEAFKNGDQIFRWITGSVYSSGCCLSLFIVDEMDKADDELVSGIESAIMNISSRLEQEPNSPKVVILLLSNTGGVAINRYVMHRVQNGATRHDLQLEQLLSVLTNIRSTPWHIHPLEAGLITALVPFLPLERRHVRRCLLQHAEKFGHVFDLEMVEKALDQLSYVPHQEQLFSKTGCRKIYALFDLVQDIAEN